MGEKCRAMMNKAIEEDRQLKEYFNSLPPVIQENIKQAGTQIRNLSDLRQCAENLMRK